MRGAEHFAFCLCSLGLCMAGHLTGPHLHCCDLICHGICRNFDF